MFCPGNKEPIVLCGDLRQLGHVPVEAVVVPDIVEADFEDAAICKWKDVMMNQTLLY